MCPRAGMPSTALASTPGSRDRHGVPTAEGVSASPLSTKAAWRTRWTTCCLLVDRSCCEERPALSASQVRSFWNLRTLEVERSRNVRSLALALSRRKVWKLGEHLRRCPVSRHATVVLKAATSVYSPSHCVWCSARVCGPALDMRTGAVGRAATPGVSKDFYSTAVSCYVQGLSWASQRDAP